MTDDLTPDSPERHAQLPCPDVGPVERRLESDDPLTVAARVRLERHVCQADGELERLDEYLARH